MPFLKSLKNFPLFQIFIKLFGIFKKFSLFQPQFFSFLKKYNKKDFSKDLYAGIMVGLISIPLVMAFAIAAGLTPKEGLVTSVIAGAMVSFLGGCRIQISGVTGATVVIVAGVVHQHGKIGLLIATIMAGIILVIIGLARLGSVLKFIPYPLMVGFTLGIALIIFSLQIENFLGLNLKNLPPEFFPKWKAYFMALSSYKPVALLVGFGSLITFILFKKFLKKIPGVLLTVIVATLISCLLKLEAHYEIKTLGSISTTIPWLTVPAFSLNIVRDLVQPAFIIALLVGMESLMSATVSDSITGDKHHSNTELMAQGFANIVTPLFGGMPSSGNLARTSASIQYGAKTPIAGIIYSLFMLLFFLFLGQFVKYIPMPTIAALLILISYEMADFKSFKSVLKSPREDVAVMLLALFLTVMVDLIVAIEVGMILAVFLFMRRMAISSNVSMLSKDFREQEVKTDPLSIQTREIPEGVGVFEINGPLFFGAADKFKEGVLNVDKAPRVRIIRMRNVPVIDSTGIRLLKDVYEDCVKHHSVLILSEIHPDPLAALKQDGLFDLIKEENFIDNIDSALSKAQDILGIKKIRLAQRLKKGGIYYNLEGEDILEAIQKTIEMIPEIPHVSKKEILATVISREEIVPTALGNGVILPHSRNPMISCVEDEIVALVFLEKPLDYETPDRKPVHSIFLTLASNAKTHLGMLSRISNLCSQAEFLELLEKRVERKEILDWIERQEQD